MKLKNLALLTILGAGSLQATIIQGSSGLASYDWFQDFSVAASGSLPGQQTALTLPTGNLFAHLQLSSSNSSTLYYDPNGSNGCSQGNAASGGSSLASMAACVGTYKETATSQTQVTAGTPGVPSEFFSILFNTPEHYVSFLLAAGGTTSPNTTTVITLHLVGGGTEVDTIHLNLSSAQDYIVLQNNAGITSIDFAPGTIGGTFGNNSLNLILGNVAASAPEPGTMALLGLGLAGVGYFARRRKAA